ncbi:MAG: FAD binding domain-containing protein [Gemmatimonadota bacterium]
MITGAFDYHAPSDLDEALDLMSDFGQDAKILAGGQSLIPMMRFRLAEPATLVDVNGIGSLSVLEETDDHLRIGAMVRHATLEDSEPTRGRYPLLAEAAGLVADPLVRNRGTVGGSLVHADPAGDWGSVMIAYRAELVARSSDGERTVPIDDFFVTTFFTSLEPEELLTEIRIPRAGPREGGAYEKLERKVGDFATVAVAARLTLAEDGTCRSAGIGLTAVGPTNLRAAEAEEALVGGPVSDETIEESSRKAAEAAQPTADNRGSEDYKRDMVRVLTARALRRAAARAGGED